MLFARTFVVPVCILSVLTLSIAASGQQTNSTRKIRIKPTEYSGQCGSSVQWRESVTKAIDESRTTGKPLFWYVPTIKGSFMDRKPVIDQYMMAGPFSWPAIAKLLNENFIPVKSIVDGELQRRFEHLRQYKFVEPGFVVLNADGSTKAIVDQITTLDPYWISSMIAGWAGVETPSLWSSSLQGTADAFRNGAQVDDKTYVETADSIAERLLLTGMIEYRAGQHEKARSIWQSAQQLQPDHPLSWKAAAEAENWGPFVRGFEVHRRLPEPAYRAGIESRGSAAPKGVYTESEIWKRSTDYLLSMQSDDGGWVDSDYDFGGTDSLPNVHVAVSALCGVSLIKALERVPDQRPELMDALTRAASYCIDRNNLNYYDRDEILWAHAYRVRFFAKLASMNHEFKTRYSPALTDAVRDLESIQTNRGTWYHEYANSFVTATALTALKQAADAGATVDQQKIRLGVVSLANDRFDNGAFPYYGVKTPRTRGSQKASGEGQVPASAGRMPLCELGLWQWGGSSDERLQTALDAAFENHQYLAVGYKYDNHTSTMAYGGFFFWYDMRSRAEALSFMSDVNKRKDLAAEHRKLVQALPELDGCFVDSHELGRCYGTAMALLTLSILDEIEK